MFPVGIMVDSLRLPIADGLVKARQLGADGVQIYATSGAMAPEALSSAVRRELLNRVRDIGLVVSALCGDPGGHGFAVAADNAARIEQSERIIELARDLDCRVVTTHIGVVPGGADGRADTAHPRFGVLQDACGRLADIAASYGATFAVETGPESSTVLRSFLDTLPAGVGVNFDPANLVMVIGENPADAVKNLAPYIVHTHAKDGRMLRKTSAELIYNFFAEGGIEDLNLGEYFIELPLGDGDVNFPVYLKALSENGYTGFLTIEREVGDNPESDIRRAVETLRAL